MRGFLFIYPYSLIFKLFSFYIFILNDQGEFRAICGGGRYDKLLSTYTQSFDDNSPSIPAVGFGFGDAVIVELLRHKKLLPSFINVKDIDVIIGTTDSDPILSERSIQTACNLREKGFKVDLMLQPKRFKYILQNADRSKINYVIIFSLHEMEDKENPKAILKSLIDGKQQIVKDSDIYSTLNEMFLSQTQSNMQQFRYFMIFILRLEYSTIVKESL